MPAPAMVGRSVRWKIEVVDEAPLLADDAADVVVAAEDAELEADELAEVEEAEDEEGEADVDVELAPPALLLTVERFGRPVVVASSASTQVMRSAARAKTW